MLNQITLIGRVGQDPDVRHTNSGDAVVNFSLATTESWKAQDGKKMEQTEWHRVVAFRKLADVISQYVQKGDLLAITGSLHYKEWTDSEGVKKITAEIKSSGMKMLGGKKGADAPKPKPSSHPAPQGQEAFDDDIPF